MHIVAHILIIAHILRKYIDKVNDTVCTFLDVTLMQTAADQQQRFVLVTPYKDKPVNTTCPVCQAYHLECRLHNWHLYLVVVRLPLF